MGISEKFTGVFGKPQGLQMSFEGISRGLQRYIGIVSRLFKAIQRFSDGFTEVIGGFKELQSFLVS